MELKFNSVQEVINFVNEINSNGEVNRNNDFVVLDCGDYKLMVSDRRGDSNNYDESMTWRFTQRWVDEKCNDVELGGFGDWVVPTKEELDLIYKNKSKFTGKDKFTYCYWSSSEDSSATAWFHDFREGEQDFISKISTFKVRGVRRIYG